MKKNNGVCLVQLFGVGGGGILLKMLSTVSPAKSVLKKS